MSRTVVRLGVLMNAERAEVRFRRASIMAELGECSQYACADLAVALQLTMYV